MATLSVRLESLTYNPLMLWYSAVVLFLLSLYGWWNARHLRTQKEYAGFGLALYVAAGIGVCGAVCFALAAMIEP